MTDARDLILHRLKTDLMGPETELEVISDRPTDRYLTGILFPPGTELSAEDDDETSDADNADETGTSLDGVKASSTFRPSSAGLSFAVRPTGPSPSLRVRVDGARYHGEQRHEESDDEHASARNLHWRRQPAFAEVQIDFATMQESGQQPLDLGQSGLSDVKLHYRLAPWGDVLMVTLAITNEARPSARKSRKANEEAGLFQVSMTVRCAEDCRFVPKPDKIRAGLDDKDAKAAALMYRDVQQWAVGHTCSAEWEEPEGGTVGSVRTSWFPEATVYVVSAGGDVEFREKPVCSRLSATWLSSQNRQELCDGLDAFVSAYAAWIDRTWLETVIPPAFTGQGEDHLKACNDAVDRMRAGIALLRTSPEVLDAFRLANAALALQYSWRPNRDPLELTWRPFQLGFVLLSLESVANPDSADRETMDLLWFPTGGGKTEAYLLLTAFTIFLRRLRAAGNPSGAGVTAFMRYTLRLLTIQQFERAAAMICACEMIRLGKAPAGATAVPAHFRSDASISLGLWVGEGATPNKVADAVSALQQPGETSAAQLHSCPCCHTTLDWGLSAHQTRIEASCPSDTCALGRVTSHLPVWTVDDTIYQERPTLLIGTVDKYAQITRKQETGALFGLNGPEAPPELIIQDELHLISGPLGSLTGLYEAAVDELCRSESGSRPKIIGSTATIRRAESQIKALFDRKSFQFPPPGLDYRNSGFAVEDRSVPGRRYIGVTTVGRSAKFTQQAVAASLLQSAKDPTIPDEIRDGYWTLVNYFNSLRELGGSMVLMRDDVGRSIGDYATRRGETDIRDAGEQIELTSRIPSNDIPRFLKNLEQPYTDPDHVDIALASNMISVGMDVSRLGLMLVNGQPKTIAEYIQATSRVGRSRKVPGLVITMFNAAKSRDRSRYESFASWHRSLYRDVEATSVTPFAPRACDRALHAPFVAMVRHLVSGMANPGAIEDHQAEAETILETLVDRIRRIDPSEAEAASNLLDEFLTQWFDHQGLQKYWDDHGDALLTSAETAAERGNRARYANQRPTPNSMRSVEASTPFVLLGGHGSTGE